METCPSTLKQAGHEVAYFIALEAETQVAYHTIQRVLRLTRVLQREHNLTNVKNFATFQPIREYRRQKKHVNVRARSM